MKNYIGFVNDHSGSMQYLTGAAVRDYNTMITSVKDAANTEMLDTVVSTVGIGVSGVPNYIKRQVVISNPHVLKPVTRWEAHGNTPLYDGIADMIDLFESLPDAKSPDVSFLLLITTDGGENGSRKFDRFTIAKRLTALQVDGRWTFVFRVPKGHKHTVAELGVPDSNIQEWETTQAGMAASTVATQAAVGGYFAARSSGARSSSAFYATAASVDISALTDITKEVSLYVVPDDKMGVEIRDFVLTKRMKFLKGAAFYQLTKTESRVSHTKMIAIRARNTGKIFAGADARKMIGLPTDQNARLHPGDHGEYDIFIQSESVNRKLVAGTGVLYWEKIGVPFTDADLAYLQPKPVAPVAAAPVALPAVAPTNRPTKSPIPVARKPHGPHVNGKPARFFESRRLARDHARTAKVKMQDLDDFDASQVEGVPAGQRWFTFQ